MSVTSTQDLEWSISASGEFGGTQTLQWSINPYVMPVAAFQALTWAVGVTEPTMELVLTEAPTGLVGSLMIAIYSDDEIETILWPTAIGIIEFPAGTGRYVATVVRPDRGRYLVVWSHNETTVTADLVIVRSGFFEVAGSLAA